MIQIDMEMPDNCQECRFLFDTLFDSKAHYYCHAMELPLFEEEVTSRPKTCPLEEVENNDMKISMVDNIINDEERGLI